MSGRTESKVSERMTSEEKALVRETWNKLAPVADVVAQRFYLRLFEVDPATRQLFRTTDLSDQRRKLIKALSFVVQGLDQLHTIAPLLSELGRRHAGYGVAERHYDSVGEALLWAFEHSLAVEWTSETSSAWARAYALVAGFMRGTECG
jgi:hemoglobin-like flavoprotein